MARAAARDWWGNSFPLGFVTSPSTAGPCDARTHGAHDRCSMVVAAPHASGSLPLSVPLARRRLPLPLPQVPRLPESARTRPRLLNTGQAVEQQDARSMAAKQGLRGVLALILCLCCAMGPSRSFNIEIEKPTIFNRSRESHFGQTVAQFESSEKCTSRSRRHLSGTVPGVTAKGQSADSDFDQMCKNIRDLLLPIAEQGR
uniref:uncharacterized protein n=1 Tax=Pristiophorus japonicus TaxID=55135 RepID=UPI00398F4B1E